jgi:hypothetical protein
VNNVCQNTVVVSVGNPDGSMPVHLVWGSHAQSQQLLHATYQLADDARYSH